MVNDARPDRPDIGRPVHWPLAKVWLSSDVAIPRVLKRPEGLLPLVVRKGFRLRGLRESASRDRHPP